MSTEANQTVHSGNTVYIMINGKIVGRAQSLQGEREYGTTYVYQIGSIMPQESIYLKYAGTITVERLRMKKENFFSLGIAALGEEILKRGVIEMLVVDNLTKEVIISYRGCSAVSYNESIQANEILTEQLQFQYLSASDTKSA